MISTVHLMSNNETHTIMTHCCAVFSHSMCTSFEVCGGMSTISHCCVIGYDH